MSSVTTLDPGSWTSLTVTHLASLASSATAGWLSAVIDDHGANTVNALDYDISIQLPMANTAPAAPSAAYVYIVPGCYISSSWVFNDGGTTTLPTSTEQAYTFGGLGANNFVGPKTMGYNAQNQTMNLDCLLSDFGRRFVPDGFSLFILNDSGAAVGASPVVNIKPLKVQSS